MSRIEQHGRWIAWVEDAWRDSRHGARTLARQPGFTALIVFMLTLGIGAMTAIFSIVSGVLLRPLPFADPDRLVQFEPMGVLDFADVRRQSSAFESTAFYGSVSRNLQGAADPERVTAVAGERGLFDVLGARPMAGRTFDPNDPPNVAVVSEAFWRRRFGGQPDVSERSIARVEGPSLNGWRITLEAETYTVIGVMPERFQFPYRSTAPDVWIPADLPPTTNRFQRIDAAVGRLKRPVSIETARAQLRTIAERLQPLYPPSSPVPAIAIVPLSDAIVGRTRVPLLLLLGAVAMVLAIACANVVNLLLTRAEARRYEAAVRIALGARRGRLIRQFLTESLLLALVGGAAAVLVALGGARLLVTLAGGGIPRASEIGFDWRVFLFLLGTSIASGVVVGVVPALGAARTGIGGVLGQHGSRASAGRRTALLNTGLVIVEIALAFILVSGSGLLIRAFVELQRAPTGLVADRVLTLRLETRGLVRPGAERDYFARIEARATQVPGVLAAGLVSRLPIQTPGNLGTIAVMGRPRAPDGRGPTVRMRDATPGYFRALGIPIVAGRLFTNADPGIVVNEALVRQHFPNEDPIGRALDRGTIVGVVGDVRQSLHLPAEPEIYRSLGQTSYSAASLVVKGAGRPEDLVAVLRSVIREVNPNQAVYNVQTMESVIAAAHPELDLYLWPIAVFGGVALALSMAGVYGVIAQAMAVRRRELAIRLALGADGRRLLGDLLTRSGMVIAAGLSIGLAGALASTRLLRAQLYGVTPTDPATFIGVIVLLSVAAFSASLTPARAALTLDPASVLRNE